MRALILSDIHANLEAFQAVLADAERRGGFDIIWGLGDLVGYGPDPSACVELLRSHEVLTVAGNHDHAATGKMETILFNDEAAAAAKWTADQLSPDQMEYLSGLPEVAKDEPFTLVHGSLRAPVWEYLLSVETALGTLRLLETQFCLVGHSHIPFLCIENQDSVDFVEFTEDQVFPMETQRWIINPGGVGQPRDRDPRPSYGLYDADQGTIERHRVSYDIQATQRKMEAVGLPGYLIHRLDHGV